MYCVEGKQRARARVRAKLGTKAKEKNLQQQFKEHRFNATHATTTLNNSTRTTR